MITAAEIRGWARVVARAGLFMDSILAVQCGHGHGARGRVRELAEMARSMNAAAARHDVDETRILAAAKRLSCEMFEAEDRPDGVHGVIPWNRLPARRKPGRPKGSKNIIKGARRG
jgi:hypothetical protein